MIKRRNTGETQKILKEWLTPRECARYQELSPRKQPDWLASRLAAKRVIQERVYEETRRGLSFSQIEITRTKGGRPSFVIVQGGCIDFDRTAYCLTLSHTCGVGVAAVSCVKQEGLVGIDIEEKRTLPRHVTEAFLTKEEQNEYAIKGANYELLVWCYKEAFLKAIGTGLRFHPGRLEVTLDASDNLLTFKKDGKKLRVKGRKFELSPRNIGAIVYVTPYD